MSRCPSFPISLRRLVLAGIATVALLATTSGFAAPASANVVVFPTAPTTLGQLLNSPPKTLARLPITIKHLGRVAVCTPSKIDAEKNIDVSQLSPSEREYVAWCVINDARSANGVPRLTDNYQLRASALGHAQRSVELRWWDLNNGLVSHVDPQTGSTPAQRIAAAGFCPAGTRLTNEDTFSS